MLNARVQAQFQSGAVEMWDTLEDPSKAFAIVEPPTTNYQTDAETAGASHDCRVLPGEDAKERDTGDGVSVGDTSYHILAVDLDVTPQPGWQLLIDGANQGKFSRVDSDPAGAQHRCWMERV